MKYSLRSLMVVVAVAPALLAILYWLSTLSNLPPLRQLDGDPNAEMSEQQKLMLKMPNSSAPAPNPPKP